MKMVKAENKTTISQDELLATGGWEYEPSFDYSGLTEVSIDSRKCGKGSLFVPLKGSRTDGHEYIGEAFKNGARASFVHRQYWEGHKEELSSYGKENGVQFVIVEDTLKALQAMAARHLEKLSSVYTIGVTGSNGKTTTKELIGSIFSFHTDVIVNEGNLNSEIGLCLAAMNVDNHHDVAVFEMGMNRRGEMQILTDIVKPDCAVITNIGTAHIGLLGSQDAIAAEKKTIFSHFDGKQTGFIFEDEPYFSFLQEGVHGKIKPFGPRSLSGLHGIENRGLAGTRISWKNIEIEFPLLGEFNVRNAIAAITVASFLKVDRKAIKKGLENAEPLFGRGQVFEGPITVIQDCYNANRESFQQALDFFNSLRWKGRKVGVIGPMKELGEYTEEAHEKLGRWIVESNCSVVFFFGEETEPAYNTVKDMAESKQVYWHTEYNELQEELAKTVAEGDIVLLKGSRAAALERLRAVLMEKRGG
jgi:UDP-N-acetylmuramoyl-tripeptide--D-alanyl-D-alanine ligase